MVKDERPAQTPTGQFSEYELRIDFQVGTEEPERVFASMAALIRTFELLDGHLTASIAPSIRPSTYLHGIDVDSLKAKLRVFLESIDDSALQELDWKQIVGTYLVRAKKKMIRWLRERETVTDRSEIENLRDELQALAEATQVRYIDIYEKIPVRILLLDLVNLAEAVRPLSLTDSVTFSSEGEHLRLNTSFEIQGNSLEDILVERIIEDRQERVMQVKKPDYLGRSMWDMKDRGHTVRVKILDDRWLDRFQERHEPVRPGDSLRADIERRLGIDEEGRVIVSRYLIHAVHEVIPRSRWHQELLFPDRKTDIDAD